MTADALALLDGAASVLRAAAPTLSGEGRYAALLSANAVATARRDLAMAARSEAARAAIGADAAAIRSGKHDEDAALYGRLVAYTALRAWIADPNALTDAERAAYVESPG
jgi:Domain of unknown function (DUF6285)